MLYSRFLGCWFYQKVPLAEDRISRIFGTGIEILWFSAWKYSLLEILGN